MFHSLAFRSLIGFAQLLLAMAAFLFLPAGTLDWWQAWAFLIAFAVPVGWITLHFLSADPALVEPRLKAGPAAEGEHSQRTIQTIAAGIFIAMIVFPAVDHRFGWSHVPAWVAIAGDLVVVVGLVVVFFVFRENTYTAATIEVEAAQSVVAGGPYGIVRHPMYAGALVMLAGVPLALGSWWGLLFWLPMAGAIVARLLEEERYLAARLAGYGAYEAKVRWRLLPGVY